MEQKTERSALSSLAGWYYTAKGPFLKIEACFRPLSVDLNDGRGACQCVKKATESDLGRRATTNKALRYTDYGSEPAPSSQTWTGWPISTLDYGCAPLVRLAQIAQRALEQTYRLLQGSHCVLTDPG